MATLVLVTALAGDSPDHSDQTPQQPKKKIEVVSPGNQDDILDGDGVLGLNIADDEK